MRMKSNLAAGLAVVAVALASSASAATLEDSALYGQWVNPKGTVVVEIGPCGSEACGVAVWASAKAQADALAGSGKALIGLRVLENLSTQKPGAWRGRVFIPNKNLRVSGAAQLIGDDGLRITGCLAGRLLCKAQVWTRRERRP